MTADEELLSLLIGLIADGFNRSLGALEKAGAVDLRKMQKHYTGTGSKFYDLVTEQMKLTARMAAPAVREFFERSH
jgi:hypothetical protein